MTRLRDKTIGDALDQFAAYRSLAAVTAVLVLILVVLPMTDDDATVSSGGSVGTAAGATGNEGAESGAVAAAPATAGTVGEPATATEDASAAPSADGDARATAPDAPTRSSGATTDAGTPAGDPSGTPPPSGGDLEGPDCDPATGRLKVPTIYAPPCVAESGNPGTTYQGVTADTIKVVVYQVERNESVDAIVATAGAEDSEEEVRQTYRDYVDYFESHYETYGREVELVFMEASGPPGDDAAARADAIKVATEIGAFASLFDPSVEVGGTYAYVEELVARGVVCIVCTYSQPAADYVDWGPYVWVPSMYYEQSAELMAEFVGKQLAHRKAEWAGDLAYQLMDRRFGLIEYDNAAGDFAFGPGYYRDALARYGATLHDAVVYPFDLARAQEQSTTMVARLKDNDITSVILYLDPIYPIFITQESTRQNYRPEWLLTGVGLTDTSFFARTYDQTQWSQAFGLGWLPVPVVDEETDAYRLHQWHHGRSPAGDATYPGAYFTLFQLFTGIHMAGPELTPHSFRDGMFRYPASGGGITTQLVSWGQSQWPWDDYAAFDDVTQLWWDPNTVEEEPGGEVNKGHYRYLAGGRRYLSGEFAEQTPSYFDPAGTVTVLRELPAEDQYPHYEHQPHR